MRTLSFRVNFDTRNISIREIDRIHSEMIGIIKNESFDVHIEDIAFNDDLHATFAVSVLASQVEGKDKEVIKNSLIQTLVAQDQDLRKFITKFNWIREGY